MGYSCGILGLPNVGKSTLFNALTKLEIESSNYPFCTIEPNKGRVVLPDDRFKKIVNWIQPKSQVHSYMDFTDIAGIVEGASQGVGLGNQFLSQIQDVQALAQVVRLFENPDIVHVGKASPVDDVKIVLTEIRLKDLQTLENRQARLLKERKTGQKEILNEINIIKELISILEKEESLINQNLSEDDKEFIKNYRLITNKPMFIIGNIGENQLDSYTKSPAYLELLDFINKEKLDLICLSAKLEEELSKLDENEAKEWLSSLGLKQSALEQLIQKGFSKLELISFFTAGKKECRHWTIKKGSSAKKAAGKIHSDIARGLIAVEQISYSDYEKYSADSKKLKEDGKIKIQSKDYIVEDGDVLYFRFQV